MLRILLLCGLLSSLFYTGMNICLPMLYEGYSMSFHLVSELFAIGAPTRPLWVRLGIVYALLVIAFGYGVWKSAADNRFLQIAGGLLFANGALSLYCPPMNMRGVAFALTDGLHIFWAIATVLLMLFAIIFATVAFGSRFRRYSIVTIVALLVFGVLTGIDGPRIALNLPTPWIGVWERLCIAAYMIWVMVLSVVLLRSAGSQPVRSHISGSI